MLTRDLLQMPDPDDLAAIENHKRLVLKSLNELLISVDEALQQALPKVATMFELWEGYVDLAVHAPNVRYLVKQYLAATSLLVTDDDEIAFQMQRVSNCGLFVDAGLAQIRILKATPSGIPKASSEARTNFVEKNRQLIFRFGAATPEPVLASLGLFITWRMDKEYKYLGMEIACPRKTRADGSVECYWLEKFEKRRLSIVPRKVDSSKIDDLRIERRDRKKLVNETEK